MSTGRLVLADGTEFTGISFGAERSISGEVVFNTGMAGYPEALTDPSYKGQILTFTYPLIGNYGVPPKDKDEMGIPKFFESDNIHVQGVLVNEYSEHYSHWNATRSLGDWLKEEGIPALTGIDTRALTKKIREHGVMLGKIIIDKDVSMYDPNEENLVAKVSTKEVKKFGSGKYHIVVVDCGIKNNILRRLLARDTKITLVPWDYDFNQLTYDGLFISNGPGDLTMCKSTIGHIKQALHKGVPTFGICLGNQLVGLAAGAETYKLKYGHRGQNQPCLSDNRGYITSQNHGFAIKSETLPDDWEILFTNGNDGTNEGVCHKTKPQFTVQFHPEGRCGPQDSDELFDRFLELIADDR